MTTSVREYAPFARSASIYNDFYLAAGSAKPYAEEAAVYLHHLAKPNNHLRHRLLEIGCGTGNFTEHFTFAGWDVIGVDSSPAMCAIAHQKGFPVIQGDIADPVRPCVISAEAAVAAFAVMSYACAATEAWNNQNVPYRCDESAMIDAVFQNVRKSLPVGGRFVFDVVNAACAMSHLRHLEDVVIETRDCERVRRLMDKRFDPHDSIVTATMTFERMARDGAAHEAWREVHKLRAFMPCELRYVLHRNGFRPLTIFPMEADSHVSGLRVGNDCWYTMVAAEAV